MKLSEIDRRTKFSTLSRMISIESCFLSLIYFAEAISFLISIEFYLEFVLFEKMLKSMFYLQIAMEKDLLSTKLKMKTKK